MCDRSWLLVYNAKQVFHEVCIRGKASCVFHFPPFSVQILPNPHSEIQGMRLRSDRILPGSPSARPFSTPSFPLCLLLRLGFICCLVTVGASVFVRVGHFKRRDHKIKVSVTLIIRIVSWNGYNDIMCYKINNYCKINVQVTAVGGTPLEKKTPTSNIMKKKFLRGNSRGSCSGTMTLQLWAFVKDKIMCIYNHMHDSIRNRIKYIDMYPVRRPGRADGLRRTTCAFKLTVQVYSFSTVVTIYVS